MTLCGEHSLVNVRGDSVFIASLPCKAWSCPDCAPKRANRLRAEALAGRPETFLTLTVRSTNFDTPDEAARALSWAWREVRRRYQRRYGRKIEFIAVFERTPSNGYPHLHVLARMAFLPQPVLSSWMDKLIGSPIVDIRRIQAKEHAVFYISKYLAKNPHVFKGCKRYWRSQGWIIDDPLGDPERPVPITGWMVEKFSAAVLIAGYRQRGWVVEEYAGMTRCRRPRQRERSPPRAGPPSCRERGRQALAVPLEGGGP